MSVRELSRGDFEYFVRYYGDMKSCHEKEFLREIEPDLMRANYRGYRKKKEDQFSDEKTKRDVLMTYSRMFTSTNTLLPNLYWQNPRKLALGLYGTNPVSAALMSCVQNYYMKVNKQKQENQESIMNGWYFGLGWKKIGYHIATEPYDETPETTLGPGERAMLGIKSVLGIKPDNLEARKVSSYIHHETLFNTSESPLDVYIDHKGDLMNYKIISHTLKRSLHDLRTFGNYEEDVLDEVYEKFRRDKGSRFDDRECEVDLVEMTIEQRNGIWILTFIDNFPKPLRYDKSSSAGSMPWSPLYFTYEPGVRYPISHMKVASNVQEWIDNVVNLQLVIMGKVRNQIYVNRQLFDKGGVENFQKNLIGGLMVGNRAATPGDIMPISSAPMKPEMFNMLAMFQQNLTEILGSTEQRVSGKSENETLGQDQMADIGSQMREGGMLDRVRDWMIDQSKKEGEVLKQYSNSELHLQITPEDFSDPETGQRMENTWVEFSTPRHPMPLMRYIQGEFDYLINIFEAVKPNNLNLRKQYIEFMQALMNPMIIQESLRRGERINFGAIVQDIGSTFELLNSKKYIEKLNPMQQAAIQATQVIENNNGAIPQSIPTSQKIADKEMEQQQMMQKGNKNV